MSVWRASSRTAPMTITSWETAAAVYSKAIRSGSDVSSAMHHITRSTSPHILCDWIRNEPGFANVVKASSQLSAENPEIARQWFNLVEHIPASVRRDELVAILLSHFPQIYRFGSPCVFGSDIDACSLMRGWTRHGLWLEALQLDSRSAAVPPSGSGPLPAARMNALCTGRQWESALRLFLASSCDGSSSSSTCNKSERDDDGSSASCCWGEVEVTQLASTLREQRASWVAAALLVRRSTTVDFSSPAFCNHVLRVFATGHRWVEATRVMQRSVDVPLFSAARSNGANSTKVLPNIVTLTEACRCLRPRWKLALSIASSCLSSANLTVETLDAKAIKHLVRCCFVGNRWREAVSLLNNSSKHGHVELVDPFTYENILTMCNRAKQHKMANKLLQLISKSGNRDAITRATNSMLQHAPTEQARQQWLQVIETRKMPMEPETYFVLIQHSSSQGRWMDSLLFLERFAASKQETERTKMTSRSSAPFVPPYVHDYLQFGLSTGGAPWNVSLQLYCLMDAQRVPLSDVSFKAVVGTCLRSGQAQRAQQLLNLMIRSGITR